MSRGDIRQRVGNSGSSGGGGPPTGPAGGDLAGTYPNPIVDGLQGVPIDPAAPAPGDTLVFDGVSYVPTPASGGDVTGVTGSEGIVVTNGGGPVPNVALPTTTDGNLLVYDTANPGWEPSNDTQAVSAFASGWTWGGPLGVLSEWQEATVTKVRLTLNDAIYGVILESVGEDFRLLSGGNVRISAGNAGTSGYVHQQGTEMYVNISPAVGPGLFHWYVANTLVLEESFSTGVGNGVLLQVQNTNGLYRIEMDSGLFAELDDDAADPVFRVNDDIEGLAFRTDTQLLYFNDAFLIWNQTKTTEHNVATADATVTTLATIPLAEDTATALDVKVVAKRNASADAASFNLSMTYVRDSAGAPVAVGTVTSSDPRATAAFAALAATIDVSGNDARVRVTGIAATNIEWIAEVQEVYRTAT